MTVAQPDVDPISLFETFIRRDPAQRGLIGSEERYGALCPGHLAAAARDLAETGGRIALVTGFYIPRGDPPAAETDGPLGAVLLADLLRQAGMRAHVITDSHCWGALSAAAEAQGFPAESLLCYPDAASALVARDWRRSFLSTPDLSHLIAIERVGPSHTLESLKSQPRDVPVPEADFQRAVPEEHRNHCHNMRGEIIDACSGDLHSLFEEAAEQRPDIRTIGIGDGGNEIGMGVVPWEELARRLSGDQAGRVPCRIACRWNILAGTSNWGAYALAAAVLLRRDKLDLLRPMDADQQRRVLEAIVARGPAVDGVTRRQEATVDGLPFLTYIQPWEGIRRVVGL